MGIVVRLRGCAGSTTMFTAKPSWRVIMASNIYGLAWLCFDRLGIRPCTIYIIFFFLLLLLLLWLYRISINHLPVMALLFYRVTTIITTITIIVIITTNSFLHLPD